MLDPSVLDLSNALNKEKIKMKQKTMAIAYVTMAFEVNTTTIHVNKCKSAYWPNGLAAKLLEELRKRAQPSDLTAVTDES